VVCGFPPLRQKKAQRWETREGGLASSHGPSRRHRRFSVPLLALPALIAGERYSQDLSVRPEVQPPVSLIAVQNAVRLEDAILIRAFFYTQELTVLPIPIDKGRGRLTGPYDDLLRFLLLCGACRTEVDAAMES